MSEAHGPIDDPPWPTQLVGRVVTRDAAPRVHGYDVQRDLAVHYRLGETILLCLTGEPPSEATGKAFEVAMTFASPVDAGEAPAHAGIVARMCGAPASGVVAVVATAMAERQRSWVAEQQALAAWLADNGTPFPEDASAKTEEDREAVTRFRACLPPAFASHPVFGHDARLDACVLAVMHACGIANEDRLVAALTIAGLASACAEAFATKPGDFKSYPMNTPPFTYLTDG
jgi:hypothetical protein